MIGHLLAGSVLLLLLTLQQDGTKVDGLIITSVLAGDKKFKTISFDSKFLKPLTFQKDIPSTEFRRHRTVRPPKFDIDVNIPIKLPLEEEYPQEEYSKRPVESNIFFQTGELDEGATNGNRYASSGRKTQTTYRDEVAAASDLSVSSQPAPKSSSLLEQGFKLLPMLAKSIKFQPSFEVSRTQARQADLAAPLARSDVREQQQQQPVDRMQSQESRYQAHYQQSEPDFIPGGFVNLQLSGPQGGPKMTYEDYDRERWAQQLSRTPGAMPYPILNYHQLQNFYGGLGTFTNGLADQRYNDAGLAKTIKSHLNKLASKFFWGRRR